MHEETKTNIQSRNVRQNPWAAWPGRVGHRGLGSVALRRVHPGNAGFLFRLAMLERSNTTARRIDGTQHVIQSP